MATKTKSAPATKKAPEKVAHADMGPERPALGRVPDQPAGGIAISPENAAVLEGDIDSRMKALLKDHKSMGARP